MGGDARLLPDVLPKVARRIAGLARRIARAAVVALVEGQELRLGPGQFGDGRSGRFGSRGGRGPGGCFLT